MPHWNRRFQRAAPTALSGSRIEPALPEVSDYLESLSSFQHRTTAFGGATLNGSAVPGGHG